MVMATTFSRNPDALPQLIGEFAPLDEWEAHISQIFYGLRAGRIRDYYQTFASADYRLAHALAADYYERVCTRDRLRTTQEGQKPAAPLVVHEWGCGNGNLAACFLSHLRKLDQAGTVYPRVRYVLVDNQEGVLEAARNHPDLAGHGERVEVLCADAAALASVQDRTVDRIICNELWNELPTKLMLRNASEVEEEYLRPNLTEAKHDEIQDWPAFVRAFEAKDSQALAQFPPFLEDIVWEKEYRKTEWRAVPYRKTITEFLKKIDEQVMVPVNLGACATLEEAKRLLAEGAIGFSSFDAGTADLAILNDPDKPCYGQFGGQYSFMINFALVEAVARHQGVATVALESQREFVGRNLGANVLSLMDLLAAYPTADRLAPWEQDRLIIQTIRLLNQRYRSPYKRSIEFTLREDMPAAQRQALEGILRSLPPDGIPDTVAYVSEEEVLGLLGELETLGYDPQMVQAALRVHPQSVDYLHLYLNY
ncbi:MAG: class I SAM-dependent methyltransferase [Nitrospirota bacterium]|nr:class I SAM-dependent methyltransferase [Nitrospirota bacterium]